MKKVLLSIFISLLVFIFPSVCFATASKNFIKKDHEIFDQWWICRTNTVGEHGFFQISQQGFRPVIVFESLGKHADIAYRMGKELAQRYPDPYQRAEKIFQFVRDKVRYVSDMDQFNYPEFAQNADELARTIKEKGFALGDCEDMAILLAVMYKGAGYRSAIVLAPGHAATLVYLPGYRKANIPLTFNGERGWIWAEATGKNNYLGWMPERFLGKKVLGYEISAEEVSLSKPKGETKPIAPKSSPNKPLMSSPFGMVVFLMFILSIFRRRRR